MKWRRIGLVAFLFCLALCVFPFVGRSTGREPITFQLPVDNVRLQLQEGELQICRERGQSLSVSKGLGIVTNFMVADWDSGAGLALAIEVKGFGESRSYWWVTVKVDPKVQAAKLGSDEIGMTKVAQGRIVENIEGLSILNLTTHGDGILINLCDRTPVPETDRRMTIQYQNDCAITSKPDLGRSQIKYFGPKVIQTLSDESKDRVWNVEGTKLQVNIPGSKSDSSPRR